ncbi:MAG: hypothetical protein LBR74_07420 [Eubacterium sp.]|jgi:Ger(x)C family germination protein|nr:hypothetical protein [Eubacterium sp.]
MSSKKIKKKTLAVCLTLLLSLAVGCTPHVELNRRIMAEAVGLDYEDGAYTLSIKYYTNSGAVSQTGSGETPKQVVLKSKGQSLSHAFKEAEFNSGEPIIFGEFKTIIMGRGMFNDDILEALNVLSLLYQSSPRMDVLGSLEKAEDLLDIKYKGEPPNGSKLDDIIENASRVGIALRSSIEIVIEQSKKINNCFYLPLIASKDTKTDQTENGKEIYIDGGIVVKNGKGAVVFDNYMSESLNLLSRGEESITITVDRNGRPTPVTLTRAKKIITPEFIDDRLVFYVDFTAHAEYLINNVNKDIVSEAKEMEDKVNKEVEKRIADATDNIIKPYAADCISLENRIRQKNYRNWTKIEDQYDDYLKSAEFIVNSDVMINRYGMLQ